MMSSLSWTGVCSISSELANAARLIVDPHTPEAIGDLQQTPNGREIKLRCFVLGVIALFCIYWSHAISVGDTEGVIR